MRDKASYLWSLYEPQTNLCKGIGVWAVCNRDGGIKFRFDIMFENMKGAPSPYCSVLNWHFSSGKL